MSTTQEGKQGDGQGDDKADADEDEDEQGDERWGGGPFAPSHLSSTSHDDTGAVCIPHAAPVPLSHCHTMMQGVISPVSVNGSTLVPLFIIINYY